MNSTTVALSVEDITTRWPHALTIVDGETGSRGPSMLPDMPDVPELLAAMCDEVLLVSECGDYEGVWLALLFHQGQYGWMEVEYSQGAYPAYRSVHSSEDFAMLAEYTEHLAESITWGQPNDILSLLAQRVQWLDDDDESEVNYYGYADKATMFLPKCAARIRARQGLVKPSPRGSMSDILGGRR